MNSYTDNKTILKTLIPIALVIMVVGFVSCNPSTTDDIESETEVAMPNSPHPLLPKIYIETSASMFGYDEPKTGVNDLREFVTKMLNQFSLSGNTESYVYVVNDSIYPHKYNTVDNLSKNSESLFDKSKGNPSYTNFQRIFSSIGKGIDSNQIGVLFSDLIVSKKGTNYDEGLLTEDILAYFKDLKDNGISTLVVKLSMKFGGEYYFESPIKKKPSERYGGGNRPVYMVLFAKDKDMRRFLTDTIYHGVRNSLMNDHRFQHSYLFQNSDNLFRNFTYSIDESTTVADDYTITENPDFTTDGGLIQGVEINKLVDTAKIELSVTAWVSNYVYDLDFLKDKSNYEIKSPVDGFKLDSIVVASSANSKGKLKITYRLIAERNGTGDREVRIALKETFPDKWIDFTDTKFDFPLDSKGAFATQTYLFKGLMTGIYQAYKMQSGTREIIRIHIND